MPSVSAKYKGVSSSLIDESEEELIKKGRMLKPFSDALREKLRELYPDNLATEDPVWGHPADAFVSEILDASNWAASQVLHLNEEITSEELRAEYTDLIKTLNAADKKLRTISPDLDRLISADAEPLGLADKVRQFLDYLQATKPHVDNLPRAKRPEQKKQHFAADMTEQVVSVIKKYDFEISGSWDPKVRGKQAHIISILGMIGEEIGINLKREAWRKLVKKTIEET